MIKIYSVKFKNFMSFGNVFSTFNFDQPGLNLIQGKNIDIPSTSNGSGKSSIVSSLVYGIYGKSVEGLKDNDLINNINNKDMVCIVIFKSDNIFYKIERFRKTTDGNGVKLFKSNTSNFTEDDEITLDNISNTNNKIIDCIGISYELFIRVACFSANHQPFFSLSPRSGTSNQSAIIEELFELLELAEKSDILKAKTKDDLISLKIEETKLEQFKKEHDRVNDQILSTKERIENWDDKKLKNISTYTQVLEHIKDIDFAPEIENHEHYSKLKSNKEIVNVKLASAKKDINVNTKAESNLNLELIDLKDSKCPYCKQQFENNDKIIETENALSKIYDIIETKKKVVDSFMDAKTILEEDLISTKDKLIYDSFDEVKTLVLQQQTINAKIEEIESELNPYIETLAELTDLELSSLNYNTINKINKDIDHQKFLYKLLTNKNSYIRKTLLNKHIPFLNDRLYYYLNELDLPHIVKFGHDLSAQIHKFGRKLEFGNLSNGQKARVNMALSLSFRDILEKIYGHINILVMDEILDYGLDGIGAELAAKILKHKTNNDNISLFVITHRNEMDSVFDNTIVIEMENNFSSVK